METLKISLQENVLTLLCFDKESLPLLANTISTRLFDSVYTQRVAKVALDYYCQYKQPAGEHLSDLLEEELSGKSKSLYTRLLDNLYELSDVINKEYVLGELRGFIQQQNLKITLKQAADLVVEEKFEQAQAVLEKSRNTQISVFDKGIDFRDVESVLSVLDYKDNRIKVGIPELDAVGANLAPKEMLVLMSLPNVGKSFFLIHVGKMALLQKKKVLHISVEMSREKVLMRYVQSIFAISSFENKIKIPKFVYDGVNKFRSFEQVEKAVKSLKDEKIKEYIRDKLNSFRYNNLIVQEFPSRQLTLEQLKAYIENLISFEKFHPDVVLLDYPDEMRLPGRQPKNIELGDLYSGLRGLAVEYFFALGVVTQSNRDGMLHKWIDAFNFSDDFKKFAIADVSITLNQSSLEYLLNTARLLLIKNRDNLKGLRLQIIQHLGISQFCLDSRKMEAKKDRYWDLVKEEEEQARKQYKRTNKRK